MGFFQLALVHTQGQLIGKHFNYYSTFKHEKHNSRKLPCFLLESSQWVHRALGNTVKIWLDENKSKVCQELTK